MSKRQKAYQYARNLPAFAGLGDETLRRFIATLAYLAKVPPETRSF